MAIALRAAITGMLAPPRPGLSVRLQVLQEARPRLEVRVGTDPSPRAGDGPSDPRVHADQAGVAFNCLVQGPPSAEEDLAAIMREVKAITEAKARLRASLTRMKEANASEAGRRTDKDDERMDRSGLDVGRGRPPGYERPLGASPDLDAVLPVLMTAYSIDVEREANALRDEMDSLGELTEEVQLRAQMYMDRYSRMMGILANLMKTVADTNRGIIQNLK